MSLGILMLVMTVVFIFFDLLIIDSCIRNYIDFYSDHMRIMFSSIKENISYSKISHVEETRNLLASPSASLDQLWIKYGYDEIKIAVQDKEGFLKKLLTKNPQIHVKRKSHD